MTGIWPGNTKCVVMLSFDFDGTSLMRRTVPDAEKYPSRLSLGEFGPKVGIFRILDLLDRYEIPASFFVPGWMVETNESTIKDIIARGHEIGHHGYMHEPPATLTLEEEVAVLDKGIEIIQRVTGQRPLGYRSPSWALDDYPYYAFNRGTGSMNTPEDVYKAWQWEFDGAYQYNSAFILTMHPQVTGRLAKIMALEKLIQYIRSHANVAFMRHIDVATAWTENGMRLA